MYEQKLLAVVFPRSPSVGVYLILQVLGEFLCAVEECVVVAQVLLHRGTSLAELLVHGLPRLLGGHELRAHLRICVCWVLVVRLSLPEACHTLQNMLLASFLECAVLAREGARKVSWPSKVMTMPIRSACNRNGCEQKHGSARFCVQQRPGVRTRLRSGHFGALVLSFFRHSRAYNFKPHSYVDFHVDNRKAVNVFHRSINNSFTLLYLIVFGRLEVQLCPHISQFFVRTLSSALLSGDLVVLRLPDTPVVKRLHRIRARILQQC